MRNLVLILGEQLNKYSAAFDGFDFEQDQVIMIESRRKAKSRKWHKHKLIAIWTAMREFASDLIADGYNVYYVTAKQSGSKSFRELLSVYYYKYGFERVIVLAPVSNVTYSHLKQLGKLIPVEIRPSNLFLYSYEELPTLPQEFTDFYIHTRKRFSVMTEGEQPMGRQWMFKHSTRKKDTKDNLISFETTGTAEMVAGYVDKEFSNYPGKSTDFDSPTTKEEAVTILDEAFLPQKPQLNTRLSLVMNLGLLHPLEILEKIKSKSFTSSASDLEKITRRIILREFLRLKYLLHNDPHIELEAKRNKKIAWYQDMNCIDQTLSQVERIGYTSAFNRHKILQNMMLLLEYDSSSTIDWFETNFVDGADWLVETNLEHNLTSMVVNAANTINLSTSFCESCMFDPKAMAGEKACPFNYLYWDFLIKYQDQLKHLSHLKVHYKRIATMSSTQKEEIHSHSESLREKLKLTRKRNTVN